MNDLISKIQTELPGFSKGQKQIARYILEHYDKAAFMTASRLGVTVGVSESTVVRFATELGYDGYPHLQRALQEMIRNKLTSVQRMEVSSDRLGGRDVLRTVLHADTDMIRQTLDEIDRDAFQGAVDALTGAHRIYILGVRSSSALANFLGFYFNLLFDNVTLVHTNSVSEIFEQVLRVLKGFPVEISGKRPIAEAIVTTGGVSVREVSPKTMESKKCSGLYFAGEVLDVDAYTGGFNLQIAWSTGRLAGLSAAQEEK